MILKFKGSNPAAIKTQAKNIDLVLVSGIALWKNNQLMIKGLNPAAISTQAKKFYSIGILRYSVSDIAL
jgi:hypothetical protein